MRQPARLNTKKDVMEGIDRVQETSKSIKSVLVQVLVRINLITVVTTVIEVEVEVLFIIVNMEETQCTVIVLITTD